MAQTLAGLNGTYAFPYNLEPPDINAGMGFPTPSDSTGFLAPLIVTPEMFGGTDYKAFNAASDYLWETNYGGQIYISKQYNLGSGDVNLAPNVSIVGSLHGKGDASSYAYPISTYGFFNFPSCLVVDPAYTININIGGSVANCYLISSTTALNAANGYNGTAVTCSLPGGSWAGSPSLVNLYALGFNTLFNTNYAPRVHVNNINMDCYNGVVVNNSGDISLIENIHAWSFLGNSGILKGTLVHINGGGSSWHKVSKCFSYGWYNTVTLTNTGNALITECGSDGAFIGALGPGVSFIIEGGDYGTAIFDKCQSTGDKCFLVNSSSSQPNVPTILVTNPQIWGPTGHGMFNTENQGSINVRGLNNYYRYDFGSITSPHSVSLETVNLGPCSVPDGVWVNGQTQKMSETSTAGDITVDASQLVTGFLSINATQTSGSTITTDTAANILPFFPYASNATTFKLRLINNDQSTTGYPITLAGGDGVTISSIIPNRAIQPGEWVDYLFSFNTPYPTPELTIQLIGTGTIS